MFEEADVELPRPPGARPDRGATERDGWPPRQGGLLAPLAAPATRGQRDDSGSNCSRARAMLSVIASF